MFKASMHIPFFAFLCLFVPLWTASTPLLILKAGRSGSSWFTYLLNRLDRVYIKEELFGRKNEKFIRLAKKVNTTAYLAESFQHPMLSYPNGEDLTKRNKRYDIIGSTFNPKNSFVRPDTLGRVVPNLRVVAYLRSNTVKHVISWIRGFALSKKCGSLVVNGRCRVTSKTVVESQNFMELLFQVIAQDQYILEFARALSAQLANDFRVVWYEDIVGLEGEIEKLLQWVGFDNNDFEFTSEFDTRCGANCTKTTPDDLRGVIANYEEIESLIKSNYICLLSQFYETRPGKVQPTVDSVCGDLFTSIVSPIVETFKK